MSGSGVGGGGVDLFDAAVGVAGEPAGVGTVVRVLGSHGQPPNPVRR